MEDLIKRQDAINAMYRLEAEDVETYSCSIPEGFDSKPAIEALKALPSAEPEQKRGEWNFVGDNMFECTHCGVVYTTQQLNGLRNYSADPYTPRFCPNCGADMRISHE